jgi:hypothetical protein
VQAPFSEVNRAQQKKEKQINEARRDKSDAILMSIKWKLYKTVFRYWATASGDGDKAGVSFCRGSAAVCADRGRARDRAVLAVAGVVVLAGLWVFRK